MCTKRSVLSLHVCYIHCNTLHTFVPQSKLLGRSGRLEWSGLLKEYKKAPQFTKYAYNLKGRLRKDWRSNVDVIVAVGSGGWYKDMVCPVTVRRENCR